MPKKSALLVILCLLTLGWHYLHSSSHSAPHLEQHAALSTPKTSNHRVQHNIPQKTFTLSQQIENFMGLKPPNMAIEQLDISPKLIKLSGQTDTINTKTTIQFLNAIKRDIPNIKHYHWQLKPDKQAFTHMDLLINLKPNKLKPNNFKNLKRLPIHTQLGQFQALNPRMGLLIQEHSLTRSCHLTLWSSYTYALNLIKYIEKNSGNLCTSLQIKKLGLAPYVEMNLICDSSC